MSEPNKESETTEPETHVSKTAESPLKRASWLGLGVGVGVGVGSAAVAAALLYANKKRRKK